MSFLKTLTLSTGNLDLILKAVKVINILIICIGLSYCVSPSSPAPVSSRSSPPASKRFVHVVKRGETLYSIAWRYGLDYKRLALVNGINQNYRIFPGQRIVLSDKATVAHKSTRVAKPVVKPQEKPVIRTAPAKPKPVVVKPKPVVVKPKTPAKPAAAPRSEKKPKPSAVNAKESQSTGSLSWRWPSKGKVLTNFYTGSSASKGIDIAGKKGESVVAAADGDVVYAGSGLRGYGKLVIIKHNDTYLSAYAHNNRLQVKEGDKVTAGQHIADIGSSGTGARNQPKLHFQIRRHGKPVDPLKILPQ